MMIFRLLFFALAIDHTNAFYMHVSQLNDLANFLQVQEYLIDLLYFKSDFTSDENPLRSPFIPFNKREPTTIFHGNIFRDLFKKSAQKPVQD